MFEQGITFEAQELVTLVRIIQRAGVLCNRMTWEITEYSQLAPVSFAGRYSHGDMRRRCSSLVA
jgi:hypothetical protein